MESPEDPKPPARRRPRKPAAPRKRAAAGKAAELPVIDAPAAADKPAADKPAADKPAAERAAVGAAAAPPDAAPHDAISADGRSAEALDPRTPEAESAAEAPAAIPPERQRPAAEPAPAYYDVLWASGLPNVATIARRELGAFFLSPIGYAVCAVLIIPVSILGYLGQIGANQPVSMELVFSLVSFLAVFFTPLYTMRLLAEERRSGTLEVLLTSPVRDWELVVGKWLGAFVFYLATIAFTLVYVVLISVFQQVHTPATILGLKVDLPSVDYGMILTGYVGVILVGAAWVALGVLASSLTSNQIIAAVVGAVTLVAFQFVFGALTGLLLPPYSDFFDYVSAANRAQSFTQGQIALRDVLYFLTLTAGALFIATRVIESRRWR